MDFCLIYTTLPDIQAAEKLAHSLIASKLVACANLFPEIKSFYEWKGKLSQDTECALLLKTRKSLYQKAEEAIKSEHPYECPCILQIPVSAGNESFLKWIASVTDKAPS